MGTAIKIVENFSKYLTNISYPTNSNSTWHISGRLKQSNQIFKFDVRDVFKIDLNQNGKYIYLKSRADKVVFELDKTWVILDMEEFTTYARDFKINKIHLNSLLSNLDWSIIIRKS